MPGLIDLRRAGIVAVAAYLLCGFALAQVPGIPGTGPAAPAKASAKPAVGDSPASEAALVTELRSRLAKETRQLEILDADETAGAPPGTDKRALQTNHVRVALMVRTLTQHLIDIEKLADTRERRQVVADELKNWAGLTEKPPYSILLADRLRAEHRAAQAELEALQARQALLQQTTAMLHDRYKEAESQLRQITEKAEIARTENTQARIDWERNAASLQIQLGKTLLSSRRPNASKSTKNLPSRKPRSENWRPKLEQIGPEARFSAEDVAQVHAALASDRDKLLAEAERLARDQARLQAITLESRKASELLAASGGRAGEAEAQYLARLYRLDQDHELKRRRLDMATTRAELLRGELDLNRTGVYSGTRVMPPIPSRMPAAARRHAKLPKS